MDRGLTCRSSADQSQNVFGNVFSDEINHVLREPIFIPLHPLLLRRDLDRFGHLSSAPARIKIIFLPIRCRGFGLLLELGPRGAPKSAIWRRLSIDFCRIRAPMRGHRKMACFPHFSPHDRSKKGNAIGKQSRRSIDAKRSLSECSMDHPSTARSEERWDRTFTALPMALLAHSRGPKPGMYPKNVRCGR